MKNDSKNGSKASNVVQNTSANKKTKKESVEIPPIAGTGSNGLMHVRRRKK